ncbi:purine catabolism regulator [Saccharopolyspora erythraea NRRL 2338]|uniref:PucR family transcriptional regulator n=1 Tax=Saccharopolyspora erythraea TaxID=1836 RepID=A0ABN1BWM4_SACER|nr:PucR family transcriptional regulator [Saccharopolyspora erythraea]PFG98842.1 purine catabolism regulator [Saccharopolyspora erythraea NRRL 2338]QRK88836.1 PucR family transcriptional regulator [Saccharopolyspora erythraea]
MSLTLRELAADRALGLVAHAGAEALERPISWVHGSELDDPTPFLEGGELLLTTGLSLRPENCAEFVDRLTGVGVAGLGFGVGLSHERVPPALEEAAARAGLPLLEVPRRTPFIAISKAVSRAIAAEEYAGLRRTSRAQHELARAAGTAHGLAAVVRKLSSLLDAWVLLLDAAGGLMHVAPASAASRLPALAADVDRLRAKKGLAAAGVSVAGQEVSMQALGGRARGFLVVGRDEPLGTTDHHVINSAASLLTLALEQVEALGSARRRLRSGFLRLMLRGEPVRDVLGDLHAELPPEPVRVLVLRGGRDPDELLQWLETEKPSSPMFLAEHDGAVVALAAESGADWLTGVPGVRIGVSDPCGEAGLADGLRQAWQAADAAGRGGAAAVVRFGELAGGGLLRLVPDGDARAFAEALLQPVRSNEVLVESLREWLAQHGQWDPAAGRLGVHRHTLRNRMRKVEDLLGRSLDQPGVRAELWLALQVLDRPGR